MQGRSFYDRVSDYKTEEWKVGVNLKRKCWETLSLHEWKRSFVLLVGCHIDTLPYEPIG